MMICPSSTGRALKKAQALAGVSNEELAKEFGVGNVAVCRWRHKDDMKFSLVVQLANRLNLTLDEFEKLGR
jgi:transcriptional regulator with XRE-family HTH domain